MKSLRERINESLMKGVGFDIKNWFNKMGTKFTKNVEDNRKLPWIALTYFSKWDDNLKEDVVPTEVTTFVETIVKELKKNIKYDNLKEDSVELDSVSDKHIYTACNTVFELDGSQDYNTQWITALDIFNSTAKRLGLRTLKHEKISRFKDSIKAEIKTPNDSIYHYVSLSLQD